MATSAAAPYPSYYQPYQAPSAPAAFGYNNTTDPRKLAQSQRQVVQSGADRLQNQDEQLRDQYAQQASGVEGYLNPIESKLAAGEGGYSPDEAQQIQLSGQDKAQIEYSPQDVNNIVNKAGISSGQATAASVNDAERAAAAAGGSPAAVATYRARAAQTAGVNAGDAMTNARVAAKNAQSGAAATGAQLESAGGQAVGNARLGQQSQGLGYESNLQAQKNSNALSEQGLGQGAFQTGVSGTGQAIGQGIEASQTPSTFDKVLGAASGVAKGLLADGTPNYMDDGQDAVVGENGMEAVIENAPKAVMDGASNPVRSETKYMDLGHLGNGDYGGETNNPSFSAADPDAVSEIDPNQQYGTANPALKQPNFLQRYLSNVKKNQQQPAQSSQPWNKTTPYQQGGEAVGAGIAALAHLSDGDSGNGDTQPWWKDLVTHEAEGMLHNFSPETFAADGQSGSGIGNYMADGEPWTDQGVSMEADGRNGMQVGRAKVFTKPTMIHLEKTDAVVPLTYRPKAKVRPSAAMPAMMAPNPQQRAPQYV